MRHVDDTPLRKKCIAYCYLNILCELEGLNALPDGITKVGPNMKAICGTFIVDMLISRFNCIVRIHLLVK